ncbi:unnamed protein product [Auanema sp. JU1783]|nr:unnamed protein product [Auanema sp. JU1783]
MNTKILTIISILLLFVMNVNSQDGSRSNVEQHQSYGQTRDANQRANVDPIHNYKAKKIDLKPKKSPWFVEKDLSK